MAEDADGGALEKELEIEHRAGYKGFLKASQILVVFVALLLGAMALFLL